MEKYKYQMHCHTTPCSHCGKTTPYQVVEALVAGGFKGACITNHFYNGNSGIDRSLSWHDFVAAYEEDWLECKRFANIYDLDILFGIEEGIGGGREILCYGVTPEMLYAHPELQEGKLELYHKALSPAGALIIQAHPFRARSYNTDIGVSSLDLIDGIELYNAENTTEANQQSADFAAKHPDIIFTSGADAHLPRNYCNAGIMTGTRLSSPEALVEVLKSGAYTLLK